MAQPTISIIGAGIGGLALGRCLLKRGIKTILYEKATCSPRHSYAITLHRGSYTPLLPVLGLDERALKSRIAVDAGIGGAGKVGSLGSSAFRAHRGKFEELLREGLEIKWEHTLEHVGQEPDGRLALHFDNGQRISSDIVIAVEGPHSPTRKQYLSDHEPTVLPYVAFNGKRKLRRDVFDELYRPAMSEGNVIESKHNDVNLTISTNDVNEDTASLSWIYSRPARDDSDPLHKPGRSTSAAKQTPEAFFREIGALKDLPQPFDDVFDAEKLRKERILHWLMRSILVPTDALQELGRKNIWLMGDAVHAEQIIGGNGANAAISDAVSLAEHVGESNVSAIEKWYAKRRKFWGADVEKSLRNIAMMHGEQQSIKDPQQHL